MKTIAPNVLAYCLFDKTAAGIFRTTAFIPRLAYELGADGVSLHKDLVNDDVIAEAERFSLRTAAWTIDDETAFKTAANFGVEDIITNDPAGLSVLRKRINLAAE